MTASAHNNIKNAYEAESARLSHQLSPVSDFMNLIHDTMTLGARDERQAIAWLFDGYSGKNSHPAQLDVEGFLHHHALYGTHYADTVLGPVIDSIIREQAARSPVMVASPSLGHVQ